MRGITKPKGFILGFLFSMFLFSNIAFGLEEVQFSNFLEEETILGSISGLIGNVFSFLILEPSADHETVFAKSLLFILLYAILFAISKKIPLTSTGPAWVRVVLSLAVAVLSTRAMTDEMIRGILLPYNALGISISVILPFIFMFYFLHDMVTSRVVRKFGWIFYGIVMLGLWITRANEGQLSSGVNSVYLAFFLVALIMLWLDGTIHKYWMSLKHGKEKAVQASAEVEILLGRRAQLMSRLASVTSPQSRGRIQKQIDTIDNQIKSLQEYT